MGLDTLYDFAKQWSYASVGVDKFINKAEIKAALGMRPDVTWEECNDAVVAATHEYVMKSMLSEVAASYCTSSRCRGWSLITHKYRGSIAALFDK